MIRECVSGGPNKYTYSVLYTGDGREKTVCKVSGISLNYNASKMVNFDVIRDMILRAKTEHGIVNVHTDRKIKRKRTGSGSVSIVPNPWIINKISFFKRRRLGVNTSVPVGGK